MEPVKVIGDEVSYQELTITVRDKETGKETTIRGTVKDLVISMPVTYEDHLPPFRPTGLWPQYRHISLHGEWVPPKGNGYFYLITILDECITILDEWYP